MKTFLFLYKLLLPIGVAILVTIFVLRSFVAVNDFAVGFLEGMSTVFIVVGAAVTLGAYLGRRDKEGKK